MSSQNILNSLSKTPVLIAYVERVKCDYLGEYNIKLDLEAIKIYMSKFVKKHGATEIYINIMLDVLDCYYNKNGEKKYGIEFQNKNQ